jgi:peptidoglycan/LPS O-acetylase OafA/YrhL
MALEPSGNPSRQHGLDAVRGGAFLLTVTFHAALSFLPGPQIWVTRDTPNMGIADFFVVSHMSHMLIFFLLAGFFARMSIERRGVGAFIKDRLLRITLPGLVFWPFVMAGIIATFVWGAITMHGGGAMSAPPKPPGFSAATFPLTHLWFLYALTLTYAGALVFVGLGKLIDPKGRMRARVYDPAMSFLVKSRLLAPVLALPVAVLFFTSPAWLPTMGITTPDTGFVPNVIAARSFSLAFLVGWVLQRQQHLLDLIRRDWFGYCLAAAVASVLLVQIKPVQFFAPITAFAHPAQLAGLYALAAWCWTIGLIGAGLRFLNEDNRVVRYVSDASYWIYIAHLPVVMAAQVLVYRLQAPALVKFAMVILGSFLVLFASYHLLVRHSVLGAWLNGRKVPWGKRQDSATLAAQTQPAKNQAGKPQEVVAA